MPYLKSLKFNLFFALTNILAIFLYFIATEHYWGSFGFLVSMGLVILLSSCFSLILQIYHIFKSPLKKKLTYIMVLSCYIVIWQNFFRYLNIYSQSL